MLHLHKPEPVRFYSKASNFVWNQMYGNNMLVAGVNTLRPRNRDVLEPEDRIRFEQLVLPHLDSAANWLDGCFEIVQIPKM